jgi:hypothetical protein
MSVFVEKLIEHTFLSDLLQAAYFRNQSIIEVGRSEADAFGYDLILSAGGTSRFIQLKASGHSVKKRWFPVNVALARKPGGCIVWIKHRVDNERLILEYAICQGDPGGFLRLDDLENARLPRYNSRGERPIRRNTKRLPVLFFGPFGDAKALLGSLFP